MVILHNQF